MNINSEKMRKAFFCSMLVFSVSAYSQIKQPPLNNEHLLSGTTYDRREIYKSREGKIFNAFSGLNKAKSFKQQEAMASSLIPIYDDVYMWNWDKSVKSW
jgi:hypothetical protein